MPQKYQTYCGYIALLGRPNAGKSSLVNSLIGQKIVGVSEKPQTTRNKVLGIFSEGPYQMLFLDTPGLHEKKGIRLNEMMNAEAWGALADADVLLYLVDVSRGWHGEEDDMLFVRLMQQAEKPVAVLASKIDKIKKHELEEGLENIQVAMDRLIERDDLQEKRELLIAEGPLEISAKRPDMLGPLRLMLAEQLPEGPFLFDPEQLTDRSQKFVSSELIREQIFRHLQKELPYQSVVVVEKLEDKPNIVVIYAAVIVARDSQKAIVIGKRGDTIKMLGMKAREQLERHFGKKVFLELQVKVDPDWYEREKKITDYTEIE